MRFNNFYLFVFLFIASTINAQTDFRPGYIINTTGDTIYGEIDYRGDLLMSIVCKFKDYEGNITEYYPNDITAFRFIDSKYYISKEVNNRLVFLEFLIKGKINIYYMRDKTNDHYYLDKEDLKLTELPYEAEIKKVDNKLVSYESNRHIGILNYYMQDASDLQSKIQSVKKPEHQNLIKLAKDYHNVVCKDEECIIYEKQLPLLKVSISPFAGIAKYKGYDDLTSQFGGYVYFWAPRLNEKIFFKTGLVYNNLTDDGSNINIYKIPVQIQYIYRKYKLQPQVSGGINLLNYYAEDYKVHSHALSLNAGLNYHLTEKLSICSVFSSDFTPFLMSSINEDTEFDIISYSINVGLRIDL